VWTIPYLFLIFFGFLNVNHFLPGGKFGVILFKISYFLGEICFLLSALLLGFSHYFIDHEGHWDNKD
jgi:hypothetical protein